MSSIAHLRARIANVDNPPPFSAWNHFPGKDQTAEELAQNTIAYQQQWQWDLVKFMPPGDYGTIDWGLKSEFTGAPAGNRTTTVTPITSVDDWKNLGPLDVRQGFMGVVLDALRLTREGVDAGTPILQTIFSPLTIADKLTNGSIVEHVRNHPAELHAALEIITEVTRDMTQASYESGGDGVFFATQQGSRDVLSPDEYAEFGIPYDLRVLETARGGTDDGFVFMHVHGDDPMLAELAHYPVDVFNWHDRVTGITLSAGADIVNKPVGGGVNQDTIDKEDPADITAGILEQIDAIKGRPCIITPGCVLRYVTTDTNKQAIADARAHVNGKGTA